MHNANLDVGTRTSINTMLQNVSNLSNNHLFLPHMLLCGLGARTLSRDNLR